jgi:hypothetical protein
MRRLIVGAGQLGFLFKDRLLRAVLRPSYFLTSSTALALGLVERIELSHYTAGCRCIAAITQHLDERLLQAK